MTMQRILVFAALGAMLTACTSDKVVTPAQAPPAPQWEVDLLPPPLETEMVFEETEEPEYIDKSIPSTSLKPGLSSKNRSRDPE